MFKQLTRSYDRRYNSAPEESTKKKRLTKEDIWPEDTGANIMSPVIFVRCPRKKATCKRKKDEVKRLSEFAKFAEEGIVLEIVELMHDLETASKEIRNPGLDQVVKKFEEFLKKRNVERIDTGGAFDPLLHEAMITEEGGGKMEEVRAGYKMHNKVIRPARVKIVK